MAKKGITINAIAPALVEDTAMLPGGSAGTEKLKESESRSLPFLRVVCIC